MFLISRKCRNGCHAKAEYDGNTVIVLKGSKVCTSQSACLSEKGIANNYRTNRKYVDEEGNVLKDCKFKSLSTAAEFVKGNTTNGWNFWKIYDGRTIQEYEDEWDRLPKNRDPISFKDATEIEFH